MKRVQYGLFGAALMMLVGCGQDSASTYQDGNYTANAKGFGGDVVAEITIEGGKLTSVSLEGNDETPAIGGEALPQLEQEFVEKGSAEIDGVSGATYTTNAAKQAVQAALDQAMGINTNEVSFQPGTYKSVVNGHNADFEIEVKVSEHAIEDIIIGDNLESHAIGDIAMNQLRQEILDNQTLNVDTLSGATVTSNAFLKGVSDACVEAGGNLSALQTKIEKNLTTPEDTSADVLIIGGGSGGIAAAVEAQQQGLHPILVEQLDILGGSSGRAAYVYAAGTVVHDNVDVDYSVEDFIETYQLTDQKAIDFEYQTSKDVNWLVELGVHMETVNLNAQVYGPDGKRVGAYIVDDLHQYLDKNDIDYRLHTKADELLLDDNGKVIGAKVIAPNGEAYTIHADSVVIATGGFFANKEMTEEYFPGWSENPFDCSVGADGSGMLMAEEVGAQLAGMDYANFHAIAGYYQGASRSLTMVAGNGGIAVNQDGERYFNEAGDYTEFTNATADQERVIAIFDQTIADLDAIKQDIGASATWGMYTVVDSVEEIAEKFDLPVENLKKTMDEYATGVESGQDAFGKDSNRMRSDLKEGPYYVVETVIENHTTYGGIVTDDETHVLRADGTQIEGLYAVGECTQKKSYMMFNLGASIYEGRQAIRTIVNE